MSLKLRYNDIHRALCYYCGVADNEEKVCLDGFIPFHVQCLEDSKTYKIKLEIIFALLNVYYLYESEYFIRDLFKHEFNNERIIKYKLIVRDRRFSIYVLTENNKLIMYSAQVENDRWDEERAELSGKDYIIFTNLIK